MQKQNEQMPHGLPKKCPPKKYKKNQQKKFLWAAVIAQVQVQDGLGHGEIEEGEKKKADFFLLSCFCTTLAVVFSFGDSKT